MKKLIEFIIKILNFVLSSAGLILLRKNKFDELTLNINLLSSLNNIHTSINDFNEGSCLCIIFSMDRAFQLHSLLSSYYEKVSNPPKVTVLYRSSDESHGQSYKDVLSMFRGKILSNDLTAIVQKDENSFKNQLISIMESSNDQKIFFLVDDIVFIEDFDMNDLIKYDMFKFIPSLRMGENLDECYTKRQKQSKPVFKTDMIKDTDKICWKWSEGELDWAYPLSVDGHIFSREEILACMKNIDFNSPNTFEGNLQSFNKHFNKRIGVFYKKSRLVNIPVNKVQNENDNRYGDLHQDELLKKWNEGYQMDFRKLYGMVNNDVHQEMVIGFVKREDYEKQS